MAPQLVLARRELFGQVDLQLVFVGLDHSQPLARLARLCQIDEHLAPSGRSGQAAAEEADDAARQGGVRIAPPRLRRIQNDGFGIAGLVSSPNQDRALVDPLGQGRDQHPVGGRLQLWLDLPSTGRFRMDSPRRQLDARIESLADQQEALVGTGFVRVGPDRWRTGCGLVLGRSESQPGSLGQENRRGIRAEQRSQE